MRRLFYKGRIAEYLKITGSDAHHLRHVLRLRTGDKVTVADDEGTVARMVLQGYSEDAALLHLREILPPESDSPIELTLYQCLLKGEKMDWVVQKATELGASRIVPVASENAVVRLDAKKAAMKCERWQRIADEAAKQCARKKLLTVAPVMPLTVAMREMEGLLLFCYECEEHASIKDELRHTEEEQISLLIGPEGGFSLEEAELIRSEGGVSVTLGKRILRAETAALAALAVVQYELGDLGR